MLTLPAVVPLVENRAPLAHCGRIEAKGLVRVWFQWRATVLTWLACCCCMALTDWLPS